MRRFIIAMTNQVERINVSHYATMNNKTSIKHDWRCFKSWSVIGRIESVRVQSDYVLKIQKINAMCGRASLRKLRGPAKGGCNWIGWFDKGHHKRESKNAKQMRNTKQNCFSHSSASPRNDKQCSAKQCFANQTNRCLAGFASRSDLFRDNARLTKHRRKVNQRLLILQAMYTTMWLDIDCWLAVSHMFR